MRRAERMWARKRTGNAAQKEKVSVTSFVSFCPELSCSTMFDIRTDTVASDAPRTGTLWWSSESQSRISRNSADVLTRVIRFILKYVCTLVTPVSIWAVGMDCERRSSDELCCIFKIISTGFAQLLYAAWCVSFTFTLSNSKCRI